MHSTGKGVPKDISKSLIHYAIAAKGKDIRSSLILGYKYAHGIDVYKSCSLAALYYKEVAEQGKIIFNLIFAFFFDYF